MWSAPPPRTSVSADAAAAAGARYQSDNVTSATPAELTGMLYTAALDRMGKARAALEAGDRAGAHPHLIRAQDIVDELRSSLDLSVGELALALDGVYGWVLEKLIDAVVHGTVADVDTARVALEPIAQAWSQSVLGQEGPTA